MSNQLAVFDPMMALVAQNIKNREATPEESLIIDSAWVNAESSIRGLAYLSREGKTWKNLTDKNGEKFTSFDDYGKKRFGYDTANLYRLADAYRVDSVLGFSHNEKTEIPITQAMQLNKLPDSAMPEVYADAIEKAREEGKKLGAKHVEEAVNEWKSKYEAIQTDLTLKVQLLDATDAKVRFQALTVDSVVKQNNELRSRDQALIDAKIAEAKAALILENQQAIAEELTKELNAL